MLGYLFSGVGYGLTAAAQPGPFQTYVISHTLKVGWRRALPAALAPLISDGPIIVLMLLVLSRVPQSWLRALYVASGLFVIYLAWGAFAAWRDFDAAAGPISEQTSVLKAALMNLISPGPYIFWGMVTGPVLLSAWREAPLHGAGFLVGFYGAMIGCLVLVIYVFGTARRLGPRVNRALLGISAVALVGFGLYQLWQGVAGRGMG